MFPSAQEGGGKREGEREGGRRLSQQLERELGTSLDQHDPFPLKHRHSAHPPTAYTSVPGAPGAWTGMAQLWLSIFRQAGSSCPGLTPSYQGCGPIALTPGDNGCPALLLPLGSSGFCLPQDSVRSLWLGRHFVRVLAPSAFLLFSPSGQLPWKLLGSVALTFLFCPGREG